MKSFPVAPYAIYVSVDALARRRRVPARPPAYSAGGTLRRDVAFCNGCSSSVGLEAEGPAAGRDGFFTTFCAGAARRPEGLVAKRRLGARIVC